MMLAVAIVALAVLFFGFGALTVLACMGAPSSDGVEWGDQS